MARQRKRKPEAEAAVLRRGREVAAVEQYWHLAARPKPRKPPKDYKYVEELARLQFELIKLQEWVRLQRPQGGASSSKAATRPARAASSSASPRASIRASAASSRSARRPSASAANGTFSATSPQLPARGEIVLFDRSWYNRAGVERVMGFCSEEEYREFLRACPLFEEMLVRSGIYLVKYWFSVNDEEQERRFQERMRNPIKRWKLSPMDMESRKHWVEYSQAKDEMFAHTDRKKAPWFVVNADDKKRARLNCIAHLLQQIPYQRHAAGRGRAAAAPGGHRLQAAEEIEPAVRKAGLLRLFICFSAGSDYIEAFTQGESRHGAANRDQDH